jgi:YfaZ precursor
MLLNRLAALVFLTFTTAAMADTADLNLRNSSAQFQYSMKMSRESLGKTELQLGALYSDDNNNRNTLGDVGVLVKDEVGNKAPGLSVGIGAKGLVAHTDGTNESAIALGGLVRYSPSSISRMGILGLAYFAPNITTFGDADRYFEYRVQAEYSVIPNAAVYIGYRDIEFNLNTGQGNTTLDEGAFIGVRMTF